MEGGGAAPELCSPATSGAADEENAPPPLDGSSRGRNVRAVAIAAALVLVVLTVPDWADRHFGTQTTPPVGVEEAATPLGTASAPPDPGAGEYAFMNVTDDGQPVTWSPCRPIHYVIRPDNAQPGQNALVTSAIARVAQVTGLTFVYDGTTDEVPSSERPAYLPDKYGKRWAPVLIAWTNTQEDPDFKEHAAGRAGPKRHRNDATSAGSYVSGIVELDPVSILFHSLAEGDSAARGIILHELAHLVGLGHVERRDQLMFPEVNGMTDFADGDLAGLFRLGTGPCQPDM